MTNTELENHAKRELLKANLSNTFSYRRAFLLGREDALSTKCIKEEDGLQKCESQCGKCKNKKG